MADVPTEAPHKVAGKGIKGGLGALKKLPPIAWVFIVAGIALVAMYIRHQQSAAAATSSDQNAGATADQGLQDTSNYGADTSQLGYLGGYQDGLAAGGGALGGFGGSSGFTTSTPVSDPGLAGTTTAPGASTLPSPTGAPVIDVTVNSQGFPTGGGAPAKPAAAHAPVGSKAGPHGAVVAPYGSKKPPAKKGYRIVGTGHGGWIYVPIKK